MYTAYLQISKPPLSAQRGGQAGFASVQTEAEITGKHPASWFTGVPFNVSENYQSAFLKEEENLGREICFSSFPH